MTPTPKNIVTYRKAAGLKLHDQNPRFIRDRQFEILCQSLRDNPDYFEARPILCTPDGQVFAGNMRLRAAREIGLKEVPVVVMDIPDERVRELMIRDNVQNGEWEAEALANNFDAEQLAEWGLEMPDFQVAKPEAVEDDYEIPDEIKTDIVAGDLFEIGRHFLLCGDSTNADDVAKLLNGAQPYLMVTDPPYGVEYDPEWREDAGVSGAGSAKGKVQNDERFDWGESYALSPAKVAYVWCASWFLPEVMGGLKLSDFAGRSLIIWAKSNFAISRGHYHWQHEPCCYAVKKGASAKWIGDRSQSTIWNIDKPQKNETGHSTQKPVECMARPIRNHEGDVYDPFVGSGTTMVASEQLGRTCYAMEIDPKYCQVIVDRMLKLDPEIQIKRNGKPYQITGR